jgi:hypothetical protein
VAPRDGADRRELRGAAVIEGIGIDGEQRTDPVEWVNRHRPGHDRSDEPIQHNWSPGPWGRPKGPGVLYYYFTSRDVRMSGRIWEGTLARGQSCSHPACSPPRGKLFLTRSRTAHQRDQEQNWCA